MTKKKWTIKQLSLLIAILLLSVATVGGSLAYIFTNTDPVKNTFTPSEVTCKINESMNGTEKKDVTVTNTGDTAAYIRAAVVVTWQNAAGEVLGELPVAGTDYVISFDTANWKESNGYYYYTGKVAAGATTPEALINSCTVKTKAPVDGYTLHVEIIADAVQADGGSKVGDVWKPAVEQAWGDVVSVNNDGSLSVKQ